MNKKSSLTYAAAFFLLSCGLILFCLTNEQNHKIYTADEAFFYFIQHGFEFKGMHLALPFLLLAIGLFMMGRHVAYEVEATLPFLGKTIRIAAVTISVISVGMAISLIVSG